MSTFSLPLSGPVDQVFRIWTSWFRSVGSQFGLVNINLGKSTNPAVESEILDQVGSYGRQLGTIGDALRVLVEQADHQGKLKDNDAIKVFLAAMKQIDNIKAQYR
jgi:hypothetical protein